MRPRAGRRKTLSASDFQRHHGLMYGAASFITRQGPGLVFDALYFLIVRDAPTSGGAHLSLRGEGFSYRIMYLCPVFGVYSFLVVLIFSEIKTLRYKNVCEGIKLLLIFMITR